MRAIQFERGGAIKVVDVPRPEPGQEEVLVRVRAAGVCHTDLHLLESARKDEYGPLIPGHEIAGEIVATGTGVFHVRVGESVAVHYEQPCLRCRYCLKKRFNLCANSKSLGFSVNGGYAEYVRVHKDSVLATKSDMDPGLAATLACSGATAYHSVATIGKAGEGDVVVVLGAGGVGLSAIQVAKARDARVLAVDVRQEAREAAQNVGADASCSPESTEKETARLSDGRGADVVVDFVGSTDTFRGGVDLLGPGGRYIMVAVMQGSATLPVGKVFERELVVTSSYSTTIADFARALELAEAGLLKSVVTRREPLQKAEEVLKELEEGRIVGRAVLEPSR